MSETRCPGQDTRYWKPGDIFEVKCSSCGNTIEFFKDDAVRRCKKCGKRVENPKVMQGCALWCENAKECLGFDPKSVDYDLEGGESLADRLIEAVKAEFGDDQRRITHFISVFEYAMDILMGEEGNPKIVTAAALLHDIGIIVAEKKHQSSAGKYREIEGPPIARRIMEELKVDEDTIEHVLNIVGNHHSVRDIDTLEFRIVRDADWLVNIPDEFDLNDRGKISEIIKKVFKTKTGMGMATSLFLGEQDSVLSVVKSRTV